MARGAITVTVEVSDIVADIATEDLESELRSRKSLVADGVPAIERELIEMARDELIRRRPESALALLDRALFPMSVWGRTLMEMPKMEGR